MKIIIIGAGVGGLQAAKLLAAAGHAVTVYERSDLSRVSYDWRDDVENKVFTELDIPQPEENHAAGLVSLVAPYSDKPLLITLDDDQRDRNINRRQFTVLLAGLAQDAGATVLFDTGVSALVFDGNAVAGVTLDNGDRVDADLVIDASGVNSPFRESLPDAMHIPKKPAADETFTVMRAYYDRNEAYPLPEKHKRKIYLKQNGAMGISWSSVEPDGVIDVLIGRIGYMSKLELSQSLDALRAVDPYIGETVLRGGGVYTIPVRYPASRLVADGYAMVGDSAFMTIPLIGSGIASSLRAGTMLAETVNAAADATVKSLWPYQVRFFREIGAGHVPVDMLKRALLKADNEAIRKGLESGIITEKDLHGILTGSGVSLTAAEILDKAGKAVKQIPLLATLGAAAAKGLAAMKIAEAIPGEFDDKKVAAWQKRLDACFGN